MKTVLATFGALGIIGVIVAFVGSGGDAPQASTSETETCTFGVTGMTCAGCEAAVRSAAREVDGVTDVEVSYKEGTAKVTYDASKTTPEVIAKTITERTGFEATPQRARNMSPFLLRCLTCFTRSSVRRSGRF
jgi:copper chaperone CopZ